ncbi:hypothetical protein [Gimesia algae]|uniref:Uncharacterized protein n=1 Tax=Gimesia algae TaxID=2527971 RepID=A0A517V8Y5_9PLAN|nr:hypothetical protein [Gimesia algae]QDT89467.1 hypothetical protein Pan161_10970 [Gimesia algae]
MAAYVFKKDLTSSASHSTIAFLMAMIHGIDGSGGTNVILELG